MAVPKLSEERVAILERIALRAHFYAMQMIHIANNRADHERTDPKVGGHPAACSSALHILGALHLAVKGPFDHLAVKPHASPTDHSYNYLLRNLFRPDSLERLSDDEMKVAMQGLRKFSLDGEPVFQSYHSKWDPDGVNFFPSGSVGIPPVQAAYLAHAYKFAEEHGYDVPKDAHFWALIGDSEFREGSLYEAIPDAAERQIANLTWIVDYNRQSLDGHRITNKQIMHGTDDKRIERTATANGWHVIQIPHGRKRLAAFELSKEGALLRDLLENGFDDYEYQSLLGGRDLAQKRETLLQKQPHLKKFLSQFSDQQVHDLIADLGGHDMGLLVDALEQSKAIHDKPVLIVAHTIKGWNLRCAAQSANHSALPDDDEIIELREKQGLPADDPFARFNHNSPEGLYLKERGSFLWEGLKEQFSIRDRNHQKFAASVEAAGGVPETLGINLKMVPIVHTQWMLGQLSAKLIRIANTPLDANKLKAGQKALTPEEARFKPAAELFVTMAPDVGTSTNLNPAMDGKIFGPETVEDFETTYHVKDTKSPDIVPGEEVSHRHLRFEIAEGNAMSCVGSYGKMREITGVPLIPLMTVYDFFIKRALDQLFYNLYWQSSFIAVGTPSGVTLSPEGAQHGWKSDIQIPNMITWEPLFAVELDWILCDSMRRHLTYDNAGRTGVLLRLVTRGVEQAEQIKRLRKQLRFKTESSLTLVTGGVEVDGAVDESQVASFNDDEILKTVRHEVLQGAYYLIDYRGYAGFVPGDNVVNIFALGAMGTEAVRASDELLKRGIYANVIAVTSHDLLVGNLAEENNFSHLKTYLGVTGDLYLNPAVNGSAHSAEVATIAGRRVPCVSVVDGEPGLLDNLGSVLGVKQIALGVKHHSKSGRPPEIYRYQAIDAEAIVEACGRVLSETALENAVVNRAALEGVEPSLIQNWRELWPTAHADGTASQTSRTPVH